ncbi:hypothetical protein A2Z33_06365 [Candidatus Gottesmanbacteria bacterium RBG_16_52_11]|uniref:Uncharacterized protein n=1 Tax=Candidatus Gottesmanbacteria bacterium RBG_16_52_11 TaxID=1798374 RepID=A0A1F5YXT5_9BACT|nr:MAG: hypothetical protein A2Z33_06365 [Candidatus Gottesmanbacteria bacterium RBG_16_52_11]
MMNKKLIVGLGALTVAGIAFLYTGRTVSAADQTYPPIVERLAQRFGLNISDVRKVFDDERSARQVQMRTQLQQRLDSAVSAGTITEAQKSAILTKHDEMKSDMENWRSLSEEERIQKMEERRNGMEDWMKANNLSIDVLRQIGFGHRGFGFGPGNHAGFGLK